MSYAGLSAQQRSMVDEAVNAMGCPPGSAPSANKYHPPKLPVWSGGPGTGKTATTRALICKARALGYKVLAGATTGAAAQRLGFQVMCI